MKKAKLLLITEANNEVASGHLLECIELLDVSRKKGYTADLLINDDACGAFKQRIDGDYYLYHSNVEEGLKRICEVITDEKYDLIVTDLRSVKEDWIKKIKEVTDAVVVCIDEWGHRELSCDVIINPMIDPYYWEYGNSKAKRFTGQEYLILPATIRDYHQRSINIPKEIKRVCISMGGVDKYGSTLIVTKWLIENKPDIFIDIVLGGGFSYTEELERLVLGKTNIDISQNISDIYEHFVRADIAFCAGGNTLHELACIGIPVIVIPTADHEINNGKRFENSGFGITISRAEAVTGADIEWAWNRMKNAENRREMTLAGRELCSGEGGNNVLSVLESLI